MPVYRCNQCGFVSEDTLLPIGTKIPCARCNTPSTLYETVFFIEKLLERYFAALREVKVLQQGITPSAPARPSQSSPATPSSLEGIDLSSTSALANAQQHAPLKAWFAEQKIDAQFDYSQVDTSGFYDDAACMLGDDYEHFAELIDRVRFAYRKTHSSVNLDLSKLSQKDAQAINNLCRQLYSHTFFARYHYQKAEKLVRLNLQTASAIRQFFDGGWLEWYAFMALLEPARNQARRFSFARGVKVVFPNEDLHELDVMCLPEGQPPICIECKSGEFRRDIDKYLRLRRRLNIDRNRFIICSADLTQEQAAGLSAMYELSFVSLSALKPHLHTLLTTS